jgi:mono/diheme cytochrome c family protein
MNLPIVTYYYMSIIILLLASCGVNETQSIQIVKNGQSLYVQHCASCHQPNGEGIAGLVPTLIKPRLDNNWINSIACTVRNGIAYESNNQKKERMPSNPNLSSKEITYIINFIEWYFLKSTLLTPETSIVSQLDQCQ